MELHTELERIIADAALTDAAAQTLRKLLDDAHRSAAAQIARRDTELHTAQTKIQALTLELAHLRRMRFGVKSEVLDAETRDLFQETLASDVAAADAELVRQTEAEATPATPRPKRERAGRQPLPEHLPRIEHRHEPESCTCGQCGKTLVKMGEDISEQLDVKPATFFVHRHIRPQYACRTCGTVTAAPIPPKSSAPRSHHHAQRFVPDGRAANDPDTCQQSPRPAILSPPCHHRSPPVESALP